MSNEDWKPVVGHETTYEVSTHGRVRRIGAAQGARVGHILSPVVDRKGYVQVKLSGKVARVHRLVALAFIGESDLPLVRHLDGDPANNSPSNLRYGTYQENSDDRILHGRHRHNGRLERTHCRYGHEYTPENTMFKREKDKRAYRQCRECHRRMRLVNRHKKRAQAAQG